MDIKGSYKLEDMELNDDELDSSKDVQNKKESSDNEIVMPSLNLEKVKAIEAALNCDPVDLEKLRELAIEDQGLVKDQLRKQAWPQLMNIDKSEFSLIPFKEDITKHKDYNQVVLDVNRTLKRFPPGIDEDYRYILMNQLTSLIIRVLEKYPHLHYYQGYHDVAITFLLVTGESVGYHLVEKLSLTHLAEFMRPSMERTTYYLTYLYPILKRANFKLYEYLVKSGVGTIFCLPWLITWYAHTLSDYRNVVRLYDFFLATPYLMPMYIAVAIVLHREKDIFNEECDMAMQHYVLSQVPDTLPFEELLKKASELYSLYPPDDMQDDVEEMVLRYKLKEEEAKRKPVERIRKVVPSPPIKWFIFPFANIIHLSSWQKTTLKVVAFAFTATIATGLYGYYTDSPYLTQYSSYFR